MRREKALVGIRVDNVNEIEYFKHNMEVLVCWATKLNIISDLKKKVTIII